MRQTPRRTMCAQSLNFHTPGATKETKAGCRPKVSTQPLRNKAGTSAATPGEGPGCMDSILLLFVVAILFVLWLVLVTFSTCNFQMKRHVHHHGFHLGGRS